MTFQPYGDIREVNDKQRIEWIRSQIQQTVDEICDCFTSHSNREKILNRILMGEKCGPLLRSQYLKQAPENFVNQNLVWPILTILGYEYKIEAIMNGLMPDLLITNTSPTLIGEVKRFGDLYIANEEMQEYLERTNGTVGLTTDGVDWRFVGIKQNQGDCLEILAEVSIRQEIAEYLMTEDIDSVDRSVISEVRNRSSSSASGFFDMLRFSRINDII